MGILGIISGLQALGNLFGANEPPAMTPAQAEGEKPKRKQQQNTVVILPTPPQPQPMVYGVPPSYWSELPPANVLRMPPVWHIPQPSITIPPLRGVPPYTEFPTYYPTPSLEELYEIYFGTRR
jgi:hypothetical protein